MWTINDIHNICLEAGQLIMSFYNQSLVVEQKEDDTPVTAADKASDAFLRRALGQLENIPILSEETEDDLKRLSAPRIWLVDPIDGTKDFIARTDEFVVNIALIEEGRPVFGAIYAPVKQELYYAFKGQGAYLLKDGKTHLLRVSDRTHNLRLLRSRHHGSKKLDALIEANKDRISQTLHVGSCYKGCVIARGDAELYYRHGLTSEWDTAPMDLLVHEAGGLVRQMDGSLFTYNRTNTVNELGFYVINHIDNTFL